MSEELYKMLHKLIDQGDWHDLSVLSTALMSGEWDNMSELDQANWLEELSD